eukprot:CAMPEP_0177669386 /NCGR_PEP_ID=MMETSP0447-20121125/23414_1 /TAXON_ID=0 /ORGANISM="Stygamoeba regulata, Strain BSH-02190019" /LENGTH=311 /DNA_ID=CAMNT_0019176251 /DNA_START=174 /DNA_END=1105 /DNA_ORIENTATION=-
MVPDETEELDEEIAAIEAEIARLERRKRLITSGNPEDVEPSLLTVWTTTQKSLDSPMCVGSDFSSPQSVSEDDYITATSPMSSPSHADSSSLASFDSDDSTNLTSSPVHSAPEETTYIPTPTSPPAPVPTPTPAPAQPPHSTPVVADMAGSVTDLPTPRTPNASPSPPPYKAPVQRARKRKSPAKAKTKTPTRKKPKRGPAESDAVLQELLRRISDDLPVERLAGIVTIVSRQLGHSEVEDSFEFDIDALDTVTLHELDAYVSGCLGADRLLLRHERRVMPRKAGRSPNPSPHPQPASSPELERPAAPTPR